MVVLMDKGGGGRESMMTSFRSASRHFKQHNRQPSEAACNDDERSSSAMAIPAMCQPQCRTTGSIEPSPSLRLS